MIVRYKVGITGILFATVGSLACYSAMAQEQAAQPAEAVQPAQPEQPLLFPQVISEPLGVDSWGNIEVGGRYFISKPGNPVPWNDPATALTNPNKKNMAKFEEYGNVPQGAYLETLQVGGQTKDAGWFADLRANDVGNNNQRYLFDWAKTGEFSGSIAYDQIPHIYSTTAMSIWGGVGTNHLTSANLVPGDYTYATPGNPYLTGGSKALPECAGLTLAANANLNGTPCGQAIMNAAFAGQAKPITIGIQRDKLGVDQRWTPTPNWDVKLDYTNEHRYGTQSAGIVIGGNGAGNAQNLNVPRPVDDTTQQGRLSTERMGETAWGKYNVKLTGTVSVYDNSYASYDVQNPFRSTAGVIGTNNFTGLYPDTARISLAPSNQAYTGNLTSGVDLPFKTRWMSTVQFSSYQQNDPFIDYTSNPVTSATYGGLLQPLTGAYGSLHGEVDTLLVNEVFNTQLGKDVKSTLRYRYYQNHNDTPELKWTGYVVEDTGPAQPAPAVPAAGVIGVARRNLDLSYTKQNVSEDLTWRANKMLNVGSSVGWEQVDRWERQALKTDELVGKVFADVTFDDIGKLRSSYQYSERRYDQYNAKAFYDYIYYSVPGTTSTNYNIRQVDIANRDRDKANVSFAFDNIPYFTGLSVTPSAGLKFDNFLTDPNAGEFGVTRDKSWNAGIEAAYVFRPGTSVMAAYIHENHDIGLIGSGSNADAATGASRYSSKMNEDVDTVIVGANVALNDSWDFNASYSIAFANEKWNSQAFGAVSQCPDITATLQCQAFPDMLTNAQRVDAVLKYKLNSTLVNKLGFSGDVTWNLKYSWDHLQTVNWQNDLSSPFFWMQDGGAALRKVDMAAINPNYDIHAVATSINFKW